MSGSGVLVASRVCDTVVMLARRVHGRIADLDSRRAFRAERASSAIMWVGGQWLDDRCGWILGVAEDRFEDCG